MQRIDALICPRWTVRVDPGAFVENDLAVAVDDGRIVAVLPEREASERFAPVARHDRPGHVLLPGLINMHCHAGMTLLRGSAEDLPLDPWLDERIRPAEARWVSREFVADGTRLAIAEMLRGGVTCFSDMYYFPDVAGEAALELGVRAVLGMIALDAPTPWASSPEECIHKGLDVHDRFKGEALIGTAFAPYAANRIGDATLRRIRQLADELDVPVHMHLHETAREVAEAIAATGRRPLERMAELGLVTPALIGVHATQLTDADIGRLAEGGASVVHCPRTNMKLGSGGCRVAALRRAGVNVALGTGSAAANNRLDVWAELQQAALLANHVAADATALTAAAAIEMATINGARALNRAEEIGSLTPGKAADVICVRLEDFAYEPVVDPLAALVYSASRTDVTDVWVAGEHLVAGGEHTRLDVAQLAAAARQWGVRLLKE